MNQSKKGGRKSSFYYHVGGEKFGSLSMAARKFGVSTTTILNWCSDGKKGKSNCYREPKNRGSSYGDDHTKSQGSVEYETAEQYLEAVVSGREFPDSARITAARCLLAYQTPKKRMKAETPSPKRLRAKEESEIEKNKLEDFNKRAAEIRAKHAKGV